MQRRHARCQPARSTPVDRTARRQPYADFIHTLQSPAAFRHLWTARPPMPPAPTSRRQEHVTARRRGQRGRGRRGRREAHCAVVESGGAPKDACAIFANHRHVGEMAANIIATAVGSNLAPVWLGHRLSSCGPFILVAGPDSIGDLGERSVLPPILTFKPETPAIR